MTTPWLVRRSLKSDSSGEMSWTGGSRRYRRRRSAQANGKRRPRGRLGPFRSRRIVPVSADERPAVELLPRNPEAPAALRGPRLAGLGLLGLRRPALPGRALAAALGLHLGLAGVGHLQLRQRLLDGRRVLAQR